MSETVWPVGAITQCAKCQSEVIREIDGWHHIGPPPGTHNPMPDPVGKFKMPGTGNVETIFRREPLTKPEIDFLLWCIGYIEGREMDATHDRAVWILERTEKMRVRLMEMV